MSKRGSLCVYRERKRESEGEREGEGSQKDGWLVRVKMKYVPVFALT